MKIMDEEEAFVSASRSLLSIVSMGGVSSAREGLDGMLGLG